ncbi:MAG TPA: cytochrome c, partial [Polyangia bacterium]
LTGQVQVTQGGYGGPGGGGCGGIVESALTIINPSSLSMSAMGVAEAVLPVDLSFSPKTGTYALLSAGNAHTPTLGQVHRIGGQIVVPGSPDMGPGSGGGGGCISDAAVPMDGEAIALAYDASDRLWVQTREPAKLQLVDAPGTTVTLSTASRADTAWAVFHSNSSASVACASCHPEGGEDGRVWQFDKIGPRRTQSLRGHVGGTEPFHWGGDLPTFDALVGEVYLRRMAGPPLAPDQEQALFAWINAIPTLPQSPPADAAAVTRGKALFEDTAHAACSSCHSGAELTNNATVDVGTGGKFQVPRLVGVGWRAPFLHDGCAATLTDRFTSCGGTTDLHGVTSGLTAAQVADLVAYLSTL